MAEVFWIDLLSARGTSLCNTQAFEGYVDRARRKGDLAITIEAPEQALEALANGRPLREGRRWSRKEEAMMRRLLKEGKTLYELADRLDRSVGAIEDRLQRPPRAACLETSSWAHSGPAISPIPATAWQVWRLCEPRLGRSRKRMPVIDLS